MRALAKTGAQASARIGDLRRRLDTRERVLQAAQMLFAERGYRGTSLRDISRRIGIKAPSLLHHFSSKDELYLAVLGRIFARLEEAAGAITSGRGSYQERILLGIDCSIDFIASHPDFARVMWKEFIDEKSAGRQLFKRRAPPLFSALVAFIRRGQEGGEFRAVDPFHFLLNLCAVTLGYFTTAAMVRRLWDKNLLEAQTIERRKHEVRDLVARTLFRD